jgi:hypothetical protein
MSAPDASIVDLDLGVFADFSPPSDEALRWACSAWGASDVVFGFWSESGRNFRPRAWRRNDVFRVVDACVGRGVRPHLMLWANRHVEAFPRALDWLDETRRVVPGVASILFDCEGHWHRGRGIASADAPKLVEERFGDIPWGVTGLTRLHKTVRPMAERANYVVPQCYSFWRPDGKHWSHSKSTSPQYQQVVGDASWRAVNDNVIMGLACYWGARPGVPGLVASLTASQTMRACAAETSALGVRDAWYWSLKWLRERSPRGEEVREFFGCKL